MCLHSGKYDSPREFRHGGEGRDPKPTTVQPLLVVLPVKLPWFPLNPLGHSTFFYKTAEWESYIYNMFQLEAYLLHQYLGNSHSYKNVCNKIFTSTAPLQIFFISINVDKNVPKINLLYKEKMYMLNIHLEHVRKSRVSFRPSSNTYH
jgi:hypothetical protein